MSNKISINSFEYDHLKALSDHLNKSKEEVVSMAIQHLFYSELKKIDSNKFIN